MAEGSIGLFLGWWRVLNALPDALLYVYLIGFFFLNQKFVLDLFFTYFLTPHIVFLSSADVTYSIWIKRMKKKSRRVLRTHAHHTFQGTTPS